MYILTIIYIHFANILKLDITFVLIEPDKLKSLWQRQTTNPGARNFRAKERYCYPDSLS